MYVEGFEVATFQVSIGDEEIDGLRAALRRTRWPRQVADAGWREGTDLAYLQELVAYWADEFDWRAVEARLNDEPQFLARVGGDDRGTGVGEPLDVHFVHRRGVGPAPLPLVLTHGWPSSFFEFHAVIGPLADPAAYGGDPADAFDVIVPSLPGYGFSSIPTRSGTGPSRMASLWTELLAGLGYERYGAAGCDWGSLVTSLMGLDHPEHLVGIHLGMVTLRSPTRDEAGATEQAEEQAFRARSRAWARTEAAYTDIQGTKPQSLACRSRRVDRREVPRVGRHQRRRRVGVHARRPAHQPLHLLVHADDRQRQPPVPRGPPQSAPPDRGRTGQGADGIPVGTRAPRGTRDAEHRTTPSPTC